MINVASSQQLCMRANLSHTTRRQHHNLVASLHSGQPVRHKDARAPLGQLLYMHVVEGESAYTSASDDLQHCLAMCDKVLPTSCCMVLMLCAIQTMGREAGAGFVTSTIGG